MASVTFKFDSGMYDSGTRQTIVYLTAQLINNPANVSDPQSFGASYTLSGLQSLIQYKSGVVSLGSNDTDTITLIFTNSGNDTSFKVVTNTDSGTFNFSLSQLTQSGTVSTPNTTWVTSSFGTNLKLENGIFTGDVFLNKTNLFSSAYNDTPLLLTLKITSNGITQNTTQYPFFFGNLSQWTQPVNISLNLSNISVEIYVVDLNGVSFSTVQTKSFTNTSSVTIPNPPVLSFTKLSNLEYVLNWSSMTGATSYNLERNLSTGNYISVTGDVNQTSINIDHADTNETYYYRVRAKNSAGYSNYSNVVTFSITGTVIPPTVTIPNPPVLSSSGIDPDNVLIFNNIVSGATEYSLERFTPNYPNWNISVPFSIIPVTNNRIEYGSNNLPVNGTYQYRARAKNSAGISSYSNVITVTKNINPPIPDNPTTQTIIQISTPNNANSIRGVFNPTSLNKWIYDNANSLLCTYPEFQGLDVPCSLSYYNTNAMVSEADNFNSVIEQIKQRYGGNTDSNVNKNLLSMLSRLFVMGTGLGLLVSKK